METSPTPTTQENAAAQAHPIASIDWVALKPFVIAFSAIVAIVVLVAGAATALSEATQKKVQTEYMQLTDEASKTIFAKRNSQHPLGGLVLLGQANNYYAQGDYAAAKSAFGTAYTGGLKSEPVLAQQAMLGEAFSQYYLDAAKGLPMIEALAANTTLMESTRAYAAYELMNQAIYANNWTTAQKYAKLITALTNARPWNKQLAALKEIYPQLAK